jgi:hypothetical protein
LNPKEKKAYKRPIGTNNDPINNAGIRISGVPTPPFLSASYIKREEEVIFKNPVSFGGEIR